MSSIELAPKQKAESDAASGPPSVTVTPAPPAFSKAVKNTLLFIFCSAQFLDAFNNSAFFAAIPPLAQDLNISNSSSVWIISAYQLTYAALLLSSGRLSDLYNAKWIFVSGMLLMAFTALGAGFVRTQVPLLVLRAFMGVGAALNIPSAMSLIVRLFPEPAEQSSAFAAFSGASGFGNVLGLIIGALLVNYASWPWVLYFCTILCFVLAVATLLLLRNKDLGDGKSKQGYSISEQFKRLDPVGITSLTIALILFIFAVTQGSIDGWGNAKVITPLVVSVVLAAFFGFWESKIPEKFASVPPSIWKYPNFPILVLLGLQPFMWWASVQLLFSWLFQEVYRWSTIITAVHFLPVGLVTFPIMGIAQRLQQRLPLKWVILIGQFLALVGTILLPFANSKSRYWPLVFPGFLIGSGGELIVFTTTNIALFVVTPPEVSGIVGAIFNCSLQLGSAAGAAIITSIQTSVQQTHGGPNSYSGRAAGFWFLFAWNVLMFIGVIFLMRYTVAPVNVNKKEEVEAEGHLAPTTSLRHD
ncbi:MFS general substrate transporter [Fomitiporia mediterranea MF3/22]|uniref:MFS general substrate transporter n=1 Tax=Fomitiporia mediterranea (strain MF3/22) TaxID=694068 RepID=UPI0004408526|nr:MFS general substrate transporter [Fomitiporia mediterranea MF3/22]EJC99629.1 MFS general substrate transporter [Fomitiporia mediterranea MF3/22]